MENAQKELENRNTSLVIHIPANFTEKLGAQGDQATIDCFINNSNPTMISTSMQNVATSLADDIRKKLQVQGIQGLLVKMDVPEEQAVQTAESILNKLETNIVITNPIPSGMHNSLAPMFLSLGMFVGAMMFARATSKMLKNLRVEMGKWKAFLSLQAVNLNSRKLGVANSFKRTIANGFGEFTTTLK